MMLLVVLSGLSPGIAYAAMTVQSLSGAVTATEISSYETFMAGRTPPTANSYDNNMADGTAGMDCESLGLMYEVTNDPVILNKMITFVDAFLALRNDHSDQRVMWTGNVEPVWLTKPAGSSGGYAGCENNEIAGHVAFCAKLILKTPSLWNTTVPDANPNGYGTTYLQRAKSYVAQIDQTEDNYMTPWFIDTATMRIKDSTQVAAAFSAFGQSTTAWNRQMMFLHGWQTMSECHALLGDDPGKVAQFDAIVSASVSWFQSEWQNTTGGGQPCYVWQYAPSHAGGNEEMNGHAAWDMWGLSRAYVAGKYGMTQTLLRPFAETLRYIIYQSGTTYTFAEWVNGDTSSTRSYIFAQWMGVAAYDPQIFGTMANADIAQGSQGSNPIYDAQILWVKNARARGYFASNTDTADFSLTTPWVESLTSGSSSNFPVTVNSLAGFTGSSVTLSMSGLPSGVTASFSATPNSTLTISTSGSVANGIYAATITGTGGGITRTAPVTLVITNLAVPGFSISATPSSQNIVMGGSTSYSVTVGSLNGFSGTVALTVSGLPAHVSGSFSPASITGGTGSSTLNITTATNAPNGDYPLTITGISGTLTNTTSVTLSFNDFSISATPASQKVIAGGSTNYTVNVGNINGFGGTVTFSAAGLPAGASASFNPTSVSLIGSSTMTVSTATNTPAGTNTITVTGVSAGLQHGTTVSLIVQGAGGGGGGSTNNLALNQTATASTIWSATYDATKGVDGDTASRWSAASGQTANQWLLVDFGSATTYDSVVIKEISFQRVTAFKIQSSTDGTTFTDLASGTTIGAALTVPFTAVSARYVRLFVTSASNVPTINEFEVYYSGATPSYTITASAGANGSISPSGGVAVKQGASQGFTITPNSGYQVSTVTVDGSSVGAVTSYTFNNVQANHTISATFSLIPVPDFTIATSPGSRTVTAGGSTNYTATISALNGFTGTVTFSVSGLPSGASGSFSPTSVNTSGTSTLTVTTTTNTPAGTNILSVVGTSGSLAHTNTVTLIVNVAGGADSNIAPGGTAYGWKANTTATANSNRTAQSGLNDGNLTADVDINSAGDAVNAWEAAGVVWSSAKTISSANFINGTVTTGGDGFLTANCKLQFSTDGSTWVDSGWTISPAYPNSNAASGQTYSFTGNAVSGKLGARVVGQVRTADTSYHWIVKEVRFIGH